MLSNYNGNRRSQSTTDVFRASSCLDDTSYPPYSYSTSNRRCPTPESPKPTATNKDTPSLKRARSYLTDDIRCQFELGFESSTTTKAQSPRSNNFVKRLVATLERRNKESNSSKIVCNAEDEFYAKSFRQRGYTVTVASPAGQSGDKQFGFLGREATPKHLEDLRERDNEEDEEENSSSDNDDFNPIFWNNYKNATSVDSPVRNSNNNNDKKFTNNNNKKVANNNNDSISEVKPTVRRTLKSMFSSLMSWRSAKSLPKGTRDYYAARESLGEEMRAFRRDTMPRLMDRVAIKKSLDHNMVSSEQREFENLIGSPKLLDDQPSIATIHPVYGSNVQHRLSRYKEEQEERLEEMPEVVHGSRKVQAPEAPIPIPAKMSTSPVIEEPHLLRPSKIKDMQKRLSRELSDSIAGSVQLRRHNNNPIISSSANIYDVPRSIRPITPERSTSLPQSRYTPPEYANLSSIINDDKRMNCVVFTTF